MAGVSACAPPCFGNKGSKFREADAFVDLSQRPFVPLLLLLFGDSFAGHGYSEEEASRTAIGNPVTFWIVQVIAWAVVVGNWVSMDCETEGGARIAAYTVGLVMFGIATVFNFMVNGANKGS